MRRFTYPLPQGKLLLTLHNEDSPEQYFSVVARNNPKREFLFLSKILGKHIPTSPSILKESYDQLARALCDETKSHDEVLFIGMAETATALSQGTYEAWLEYNHTCNSVFVSTTRYHIRNQKRIEFSEAHSHATSIGLYVPQDEVLRKRFMNAKTVVIIDDELSTGNTVISLVESLVSHNIPVERVITVCLTDFSCEHKSSVREALHPITTTTVCLVQGQWKYHPQVIANNDTSVEKSGQAAVERVAYVQAQSDTPVFLPNSQDLMARLGTSHPLRLSQVLKKQCERLLASHAGNRILILGTGEFMYPPMLIAHYFETLGACSDFCATTRSPIKVWGDIVTKKTFDDPYGEGVNNYLYNYQRNNYDVVLLVSEQPENTELHQTARALDAELICLNEEHFENHIIY